MTESEVRAPLARAFPSLAPYLPYLPLSRDQLMLLLVSVNLLFLGVDTYLAHLISGTIVPREWIPILFGPTAAVLMFVAGLIALKFRHLASTIATLTLIASFGVGVLGAYYHFMRATLPAAPPGQRISIYLLMWAPPVLGPLSFSLIGWLGISAAWIEDPPDSGRLYLPGRWKLALPFSKTRAYYFMVGLGSLMALISSVLDHGRHHFGDPWMWLATAVGIFGSVVPVGLGILRSPNRGDLLTYCFAMLLLIALGPLGTFLHVMANLTAGGSIVVERFIRGAPFLAPLLFSNMGILGFITMLHPSEFRFGSLEQLPELDETV